MMRLSSGNEGVLAVMRTLGGPIIRLITIAIFLVFSLYLGYRHAYAPLFDDVQLPAAVQVESVRINTTILDPINAATAGRRSHVPHTYDQYRTLFAPVSDE